MVILSEQESVLSSDTRVSREGSEGCETNSVQQGLSPIHEPRTRQQHVRHSAIDVSSFPCCCIVYSNNLDFTFLESLFSCILCMFLSTLCEQCYIFVEYTYVLSIYLPHHSFKGRLKSLIAVIWSTVSGCKIRLFHLEFGIECVVKMPDFLRSTNIFRITVSCWNFLWMLPVG